MDRGAKIGLVGGGVAGATAGGRVLGGPHKKQEKTAVFGVTPWDVKSPEELDSVEGYAKERGNMLVGQGVGALTGGAIGAAVGETGLGKKINPKFVAKLPNKSNTLFLALLGALSGGWLGGVRSLRKTEREAGVEPTGPGKYFGRTAGTLGGALTIPI